MRCLTAGETHTFRHFNMTKTFMGRPYLFQVERVSSGWSALICSNLDVTLYTTHPRIREAAKPGASAHLEIFAKKIVEEGLFNWSSNSKTEKRCKCLLFLKTGAKKCAPPPTAGPQSAVGQNWNMTKRPRLARSQRRSNN